MTDNIVTLSTSEPRWLESLARSYKLRQTVVLLDDAHVGIDPAGQTLLGIARQAGLSHRELAGVLVSLGVSGAGVWMIVMAIIDPEPTSKLGLLVGGGVTCVLGGGLSAVRILTNSKPPNVTLTAAGFKISWD